MGERGNVILLREGRIGVECCVTERQRGGKSVWKAAKLALRNGWMTSKAGFDEIVRNIQAEAKEFVPCTKIVCMLQLKEILSLVVEMEENQIIANGTNPKEKNLLVHKFKMRGQSRLGTRNLFLPTITYYFLALATADLNLFLSAVVSKNFLYDMSSKVPVIP